MFFLLSNAFPKITHTAAGWDLIFYYPFNNMGHPFVRLSNVPHHTLIQASILLAFVLYGDIFSIFQKISAGFGSAWNHSWEHATASMGICNWSHRTVQHIFFTLAYSIHSSWAFRPPLRLIYTTSLLRFFIYVHDELERINKCLFHLKSLWYYMVLSCLWV